MGQAHIKYRYADISEDVQLVFLGKVPAYGEMAFKPRNSCGLEPETFWQQRKIWRESGAVELFYYKKSFRFCKEGIRDCSLRRDSCAGFTGSVHKKGCRFAAAWRKGVECELDIGPGVGETTFDRAIDKRNPGVCDSQTVYG